MTTRALKVRYTPAAEADLREAWRHIAQFDPAAAQRFYDAVSKRTENLRDFPDIGSPRSELGEGIRMLVEGRYLIFYRRELEFVRILRVLYGSRDLGSIFRSSFV